jgi:hypothetical protein
MNSIKHIIYLLLVFLGQASSVLFALDVRCCYIKDRTKHEANQKILKSILEQELAYPISNWEPADQANYLSASITKITEALIRKGFMADAYEVPKVDQNSILSFKSFALWEGDGNGPGSIPITFFVYVWPSEELALLYNPSDPANYRYASNIHSHPISCAFAVLQGALHQTNYQHTSPCNRIVKIIGEEMFQEGEGEVDDLQKPFIHKLCNRSAHSRVCLSLHAYGLPSAEKVMACFRETFSECSYEEQ